MRRTHSSGCIYVLAPCRGSRAAGLQGGGGLLQHVAPLISGAAPDRFAGDALLDGHSRGLPSRMRLRDLKGSRPSGSNEGRGERLAAARTRARRASPDRAIPPPPTGRAARRAGQTEQIAGPQIGGVAVNEDHSALIFGLGKIQSLDRARQGSLEPGSYRHTTIRRSSRPRQ